MRYGFLVLLVACADKTPEDTAVVLEGPVLSHIEPGAVVDGSAATLSVTATDDDGVAGVTLYHRVSGETTWTQAPMVQGESDLWSVTLEGSDIDDPSVQYYFKAADSGEIPATSYLPADAASAPFALPVSVVGAPLPYVQGFEFEGTQATLSDLGWANASLGFFGYGWATSAAEAASGAQSAFHSRGYTGIDQLEDWLISPALDFSGVSDAQVTWKEFGRQTDLADHALYVSTGSRDPSGGDYVAVAERLPAPAEAEWARSAIYDLSAHAGSPTVYLAWRFVGATSDDWYIDDVRVEPLQPDLVLDATVAPSPIDPGGVGTYTVSIDNLGLVDASGLTVTVAFPEGGASVAEESVSIASIASGGAAVAAFDLTVGAETPDNRYLPTLVTVTQGESSWTYDEPLLVGVASTATLVYTPSAAGDLALTLGVGDPDAPAWEQTVYDADAADTVTLSVDITDQADLLPPSAGELRWFVRASAEVEGTLDDFTVTYDGVTYAARVLPTVAAEGEALAYVPEPPAFDVVASTTPSELSPGDTAVSLNLFVTNTGDATQGGVVVTLGSDDPNVTITDAGPYTVSAAALGAGASVSVAGAFAFDVAASHTDSTDLALELVFDDGVESWVLPLAVAVPFPYLAVGAIDIDDDGRDGVLDPDESAELTIEVANLGGESTTSALTAVLAVETTSTATVSVSTNSESYRELASTRTDTNDSPWTVTVTGGADGDTVDLLLTLLDSARAYEVRTTLVLGEPTWEELDPRGDTTGDALEGWDFDLVAGRYRVFDGILQIQLESATIFDPDTLFVESWGQSTVADWTYYRLVLQSGVARLEGYDGGFVNISTPVLSYPSSTEVQVDIELADMGLALDTLSLGFATGWCGPPEYYCDHFPNGWGYPYDSWSPGLFFDLTW